MNLILDNRENDLIENINKLNIKFEKKNLLLGDISFNKDGKELLIIERKTLTDLLASIKDGRHREQKVRLMSKQNENVQIYYLYEGDIYNHKNKDLIMSCAFNTMIRDNIKIIYSKNLNDTTDIIKKLLKKTVEFENLLVNNEMNKTMDYSDTIKSEKKKNMTKDICFLAMLKQIPGVSTKCANSISKEYLNMSNLILKYQMLENEDEKKKLLKNIVIEKKRIGEKLSEKIYNFLI